MLHKANESNVEVHNIFRKYWIDIEDVFQESHILPQTNIQKSYSSWISLEVDCEMHDY